MRLAMIGLGLNRFVAESNLGVCVIELAESYFSEFTLVSQKGALITALTSCESWTGVVSCL